MQEDEIERLRGEVALTDALRRHRTLVGLIVLLCTAGSVVLALLQPPAYRAGTDIILPSPGPTDPDGTVERNLVDEAVLLGSSDMAERAAVLADEALGSDVLAARDFAGDGAALEVAPLSENTSEGSSDTLTVRFTWTDPLTAQVAADAAVRAFEEVRTASIQAQSDAAVAALRRAVERAGGDGQEPQLVAQLNNALAAQQIALGVRPTVVRGAPPDQPVNRDWKLAAAVGAVVGVVLGATIAYTRVLRHGGLDTPGAPVAVYRAPLVVELLGPGPVAHLLRRFRRRSPWDGETGRFGDRLAEAFRFAASAVERLRADGRGPRQVLAVVAPRSTPATAVVTAGLARALAESGVRVLVVDASGGDRAAVSGLLLRDPEAGSGLAEVLGGTATTAAGVRPRPGIAGVDVLPAGRPGVDRPMGVAYRRALAKVLVDGCVNHDVVLVDTPGLLHRADAVEVVGAARALVLVVGPDESGADHATASGRLALLDADVLGYVYAGKGPWSGVRPVALPRPEEAGRTEPAGGLGGQAPGRAAPPRIVPSPVPRTAQPVRAGMDDTPSRRSLQERRGPPCAR